MKEIEFGQLALVVSLCSEVLTAKEFVGLQMIAVTLHEMFKTH